MNRYKKLMSDTVILAIGSFGSKILSIMLFPLFTTYLLQSELGQAEIMTQTANLLFYFATVGIINGVVRYGLDASYDKTDVFTTGVRVTFIGLLVLVLLSPLLRFVPGLDNSTFIVAVVIFVIGSSLRGLCSQFTRSIGQVRLYAFDGVLSTVFVVIFNLLFIVVFKMGPIGSVLATAAADFISAIFLFVFGRLYRYVTLKKVNKELRNSMLRYSAPMISNNVFWWITNVSNRFIIEGFHGPEEVGLFAAANKLPNLISVVSAIFMDAWQLSAVGEMSEKERASFFTRIFRNYWGFVMALTSGIILFAKVLIQILTVGKNSALYYPAWKSIPLLALSVAFSCFASFFGSVYMLEYRSIRSFATTVIGAVLNVGLTFLLVPRFFSVGAAAALFISYAAVFAVRAFDILQFIKMRYPKKQIVITCILIGIQTIVMMTEWKIGSFAIWIPVSTILCAIIVFMNTREIIGNALLFLDSKINERKILKQLQAESSRNNGTKNIEH